MALNPQELLFYSNRPEALPVYEALQKEALALPGTQIKVQKTQITFSAPKGYCVLAHPPVKSMGQSAVICCLSLGYPLTHPLVLHNVQVSLHRFTCRLLLKNQEDVSAILPLLQEAYEAFGRKNAFP